MSGVSLETKKERNRCSINRCEKLNYWLGMTAMGNQETNQEKMMNQKRRTILARVMVKFVVHRAMIHRTEEKEVDQSVTEHRLNGWLIFTWMTRNFSCVAFKVEIGEFSYFLLCTVHIVVWECDREIKGECG